MQGGIVRCSHFDTCLRILALSESEFLGQPF